MTHKAAKKLLYFLKKQAGFSSEDRSRYIKMSFDDMLGVGAFCWDIMQCHMSRMLFSLAI